MIYLDSSVALAHLLAEDRSPPESIWRETLVSSRLLEYEVWNRINARRLGPSHGEAARTLIGHVALIELAPPVLARALESFPIPVRTLDALQLSTALWLKSQQQLDHFLCADPRLCEAAQQEGLSVINPEEP